MTEESLFAAAVAIPDPAARAAFLDQACAGSVELRQQLDALVAAHFAADPVLDATRPPPESDHTQSVGDRTHSRPSPLEAVGTVIAGRYKLLQRIGEGGMGSVWMAEQTEPVKRRVAVKLIRAERGNSKTILSRFEAERQAIALMDHPHIAKLLDAGAVDGSPFFVMELVKGVPLTEFCDSHKLSIPDRLALFTHICSAVQHAHQKGVIHRDLKPTNILVESHDGKPVPKVIDFGLAKATTGLQLTEHTLFTGFGSVMGTPLYMAPEQAMFNAVDVDTRADIYALGVILYELLTGTTPLTRETIKKAALDEMLRLIREQEPPTPSSRLSSSEAKPTVAANRQTEPAKLGRFVRGELDWIVLKALSKDRDRRYESAPHFAKDIERFLNHEPVQAVPVGVGYRVRKFVRRNRGPVLAGTLILLALLLGIAGTTFGLLRAEDKRVEAEQAKERESERATGEQLAKAQAEAEKQRAIEFRDKAVEALRATTGEDVEKLIGGKPELGTNEKAYLEAIAKRWQAFANQEGIDEQSRANRAEGHYRVGLLWQKLGRREEAQREYEQALVLREKLVANYPAVPGYRSDLATSHNDLGAVLDERKRPEAEEQIRKALAIRERLAADFPAVPEYRRDLAQSHSDLAGVLHGLGKHPEAEAQIRKALAIREKLMADFPAIPDYRRDRARSHTGLGIVLHDQRKYSEAEEQYRQGLAIWERLMADFPAVPEYRWGLAKGRNGLGILLHDQRKLPEGQEQHHKALAIRERLAADFPAKPEYRRDLAGSHNNLALLLIDTGKRTEAEAHYRQGLAIREKLVADFPAIPAYQVELGGNYCNFGSLVRDGGNPADSVTWFDKAIAALRPVHEAEPWAFTAKLFLRNSHLGRASTYDRLKKYPEALTDWDRAVELSEKQEQPQVRASRATSKANAGRVADAVAEVVELLKLPGWNAVQLFNFACVYSVASGKIADKKQEYANAAMELLQKSVKAGYKDASHMKTDADLDPIRSRDDFNKLLADLETKFPPKPETLPTPPKE